MTSEQESVRRLALAEKELCARLGPCLEVIVAHIASQHGIDIREVRLTFEKAKGDKHWKGANCVIVR